MNGIVTVGLQAGWEHVLVPAEPTLAGVKFGVGFIDGYIGHFSERVLVDQVRQTAIPAVDISSDLPESGLARVITDEVAVGRLAASYLLSLGLPRFGYVGIADDYPSTARGTGLAETLAEAGYECHRFLQSSGTHDEAPAAPPDALQKWMEKLPTPIGVFASTDVLGFQVLAICRKRHIAVPNQAAVVGVGNDDLLCNLTNPPMSSIALATQRIGFDGAQMLADLMNGKKPPAREILIPPVAVIPRQSSALAPIMDRDVAAAIGYIALHAKDNLRVADVLRSISVSRSSLDQRFMKALGRTPASEIRRVQIELAKTMLSETQEQMGQVAIAAGFRDAKQLTATFHRETGSTPTAYRKQLQRPGSAE